MHAVSTTLSAEKAQAIDRVAEEQGQAAMYLVAVAATVLSDVAVLEYIRTKHAALFSADKQQALQQIIGVLQLQHAASTAVH
jgi:hypothetical protein